MQQINHVIKVPISVSFNARKEVQQVLLVLTLIAYSQISWAQEISPYLFGQNLWLTSGAEGRPGYIDQVWPQVKESGVSIVRIGGGNYDRHMPPLSTLQSWVKSIKAIGAEPLLQVSKLGTPEESAALVKAFNKAEGSYIKFWSIGNEPYRIGKYSIDSIANYIKRHASAMKAVDPKIKILVPDLAAYYNEAYDELLRSDKNGIAGRDKNGNWYVDGINFHNYPNAKNYNRSDVIFYSVAKMRGMVLNLLEDLAYANKKYGREGKDELVWGITEFNITYNNPDDLSATGIAVPSFINGQFWADIFCMAMEYKAFTVTPWCIQESDRPSTYFGYIGAPPLFTPHPTFYHEQMLSKYMKGDYIKMKSGSPYLKVFGSMTTETATILLMNQDSTNSYNVDLNAINSENFAAGILNITAEKRILAKFKGQIKPNATVLLTFDKLGNKTLQLIYDLELAINNKPPKTVTDE